MTKVFAQKALGPMQLGGTVGEKSHYAQNPSMGLIG